MRGDREGGEVRESLQSVGKALAVVDLLANCGEMSLQEISAELRMTRTSAHRVLHKLREHAYIAQDDATARYHLGTALWELGMRVPRPMRVYEVAMPFLQQLTDRLGRLTVLAIYDRGDVLAVGTASRQGEVSVAQPTAARSPAHCNALGKVALAYQPSAEIERVLRSDLTAFTSSTIVDREQLRVELQRVREQGFATNRGEHRPETCGIAAPVLGYASRFVATVGVSCPCEDFTPAFIEEAQQPLLECARTLSITFGLRDLDLQQASLA